MAVTMLNPQLNPNQTTPSLEDYIRTALELGELAPALNQRIQHLAAGLVSDREQKLLQLLEDAIRDGCIAIPPDARLNNTRTPD